MTDAERQRLLSALPHLAPPDREWLAVRLALDDAARAQTVRVHPTASSGAPEVARPGRWRRREVIRRTQVIVDRTD